MGRGQCQRPPPQPQWCSPQGCPRLWAPLQHHHWCYRGCQQPQQPGWHSHRSSMYCSSHRDRLSRTCRPWGCHRHQARQPQSLRRRPGIRHGRPRRRSTKRRHHQGFVHLFQQVHHQVRKGCQASRRLVRAGKGSQPRLQGSRMCRWAHPTPQGFQRRDPSQGCQRRMP